MNIYEDMGIKQSTDKPKRLKAVRPAPTRANMHGATREVPKLFEPDWQYHFCTDHAEFNNWRGSCPHSIDDCLLTRVLDAKGNIDKIRGLDIGQGITTDMVIDEWLNSGEKIEVLFRDPIWLIVMARSMAKETVKETTGKLLTPKPCRY